MEPYWGVRSGMVLCSAARVALRAGLAWSLIADKALFTGVEDGEDSAGRAKLKVMPPGELVARAFAIADAFVAEAERRGELRPHTDADEEASYRRTGELEEVRSEARFGASDVRAAWKLAREKAAQEPTSPAAPESKS